MAKIVVGVDGSDHAAMALRWAAKRAEHRGDEVVAVLAWNAVSQPDDPPDPDRVVALGDAEVQRVLDDAVVEAGCTMLVTKLTVIGDAAEALIETADPEDLVVVGSRGLGGFRRLLLGSVGIKILELATCPVVVIHDELADTPGGEVVVGFDGSAMSMSALRWAAQEARELATTVRIVHAWEPSAYAEMNVPEVLEDLAQQAKDLVAKAAEDPSLEGVTVIQDAVRDGPANALLAHEDEAAMIVVSSRGFSALKRAVLGSTSRQLAIHATTPVVVVPAGG